jgi:drug/metabolite transporter (DMT)-like permease
VLLVIRPGVSGFNFYALVVLVSVAFVAFRDIWTQAMPSAIPTILLSGVTSLAVVAMGAAMGISEDWAWPRLTVWLELAAAGMLLSAGYFFVIAAMRLGDMSVTAPFRYVSVVFAITLGYLIWNETPEALTLAGSAIIIAAGLYTLYRERKTGSAAPATKSALAADRQG